MAEYRSLDDYPWPDDIFDQSGQVDEDRLMQILESNPSLMKIFQETYGTGEDDFYSDSDLMRSPDMTDYTQSLSDIYTDCIIPNMRGAADSVTLLLLACLLCCIIGRLASSRPTITHSIFCILGCSVLYKFFSINALILGLYLVTSTLLLQLKSLHTKMGVILSLLTLVYVIACEFLVPADRWHNVRGAQMVLSMKVISLGFDITNESVKHTYLLSTMSYLLHPASSIFGPWISYQYYHDGVTAKRVWLDIRWIYHVMRSLLLSGIFLIWSSCMLSYLIPDYSLYNKWIYAYRDAQSFRFSHYFICSLSECTLLLSGIAVYTEYKSDNKNHQSGGELSSHVSVSQPINIEIPRSLVEVVTSWNLPMHRWLKNYVFRITRPKFGTFSAVLLTYISSSLLHGLNFQLAAVLLSLGFYSYIEHRLRHTLSNTFSICIEARRCPPTCDHRHKHLAPLTILINTLFTCLAMYHLAYLGVMFDTSNESDHETGYTMWYTLSKWSYLHYSSHVIALCTYIFYWLIK